VTLYIILLFVGDQKYEHIKLTFNVVIFPFVVCKYKVLLCFENNFMHKVWEGLKFDNERTQPNNC